MRCGGKERRAGAKSHDVHSGRSHRADAKRETRGVGANAISESSDIQFFVQSARTANRMLPPVSDSQF